MNENGEFPYFFGVPRMLTLKLYQNRYVQFLKLAIFRMNLQQKVYIIDMWCLKNNAFYLLSDCYRTCEKQILKSVENVLILFYYFKHPVPQKRRQLTQTFNYNFCVKNQKHHFFAGKL